MKKKVKISIVFFTLMTILFGCETNPNNSKMSNNNNTQVHEKENENDIIIGNQNWMKINLNTDTFRNGDIIPEAKTTEEWNAANEEKKPAWCYYNNDSTNQSKYGKLYNWYAVNDYRGIAPKGYVVPNFEDYETLINFAGGRYEPTSAFKIKSTKGWISNENKGNNETGFSAMPGGYRNEDGSFSEIGENGAWWCRDETTDANYHAYFVWFEQNVFGDIQGRGCLKARGLSVRCIKYIQK